jgi:RNA polymerase sigma-70 factor (ECF subfamily)
MTDRELLEAIADGDVAALRLLYERHAPWMVARLSRRVTDPGVVDEAVQDTFVVVWRQADRFRGEGEVAAWLWGIAIRRAIDRLRSNRIPRLVRPEVVASAEEAVLVGLVYGDVGDALSRLSPELMAVVQARLLDGLSTREAARLLGIPAGTVKTRLMKAKQVLREQLT